MNRWNRKVKDEEQQGGRFRAGDGSCTAKNMEVNMN